ncbi:MAG: urea ABC transporter ATP-binding subunit UrtE [Alphaproteobacteria bacterium]|nr:urea ABC transporter ATP-binding subunit UrtE [Alphaproteobacteria bacterium]MBU1279657.1 urea ABC transporter ATP-binding subunit UrtE [Alphaproteobacteria bacterium]MBU1571981.1 urea ABC transporter ATP-binding subunit UrtE [Alphaproteobacteria bacterium]MBU1828255.1 urea ABC transporter ATP-binding subunit UrtE [Alphaproteobacteria bacterium]MBU2078680.1 urea ABC transporter ATP-binding subunit UrtE [Alphaproteobacteria bacterium]
MLDVKDLSLHYGGSQILYDVDLSARAGEVTCVMGTNGVGKTSLLKGICGTHPRSGGTMMLDGEDVGRAPAHELAKKGLAVVPQGRMIFPLLTVKENLESGFTCLPKSEHFIPDEVFELFPILKEFMHRRGGDLSGGQQQQLAIARALIIKPKLLLLDEPTEGIQPNIIQQIGRVIALLRDRGDMAIVLVEQYFEFAYDLADQLVFMERGRVTSRHSKSQISKEEAAKTFRIA